MSYFVILHTFYFIKRTSVFIWLLQRATQNKKNNNNNSSNKFHNIKIESKSSQQIPNKNSQILRNNQRMYFIFTHKTKADDNMCFD